MDKLDREVVENLSDPAKRLFYSLDHNSQRRVLKQAKEIIAWQFLLLKYPAVCLLIAICHQKCYSIYIKICDKQMEAIEMGQSATSVHLDEPFYGESNAKVLKESIEQMEQHPEKNVVKSLEELEELADG